jgi:hypothetical protein
MPILSPLFLQQQKIYLIYLLLLLFFFFFGFNDNKYENYTQNITISN